MRSSPWSRLTALAAGITAGVSALAGDTGAQAPGLQDPDELAVVAEINAVRARHRVPRVRPKAVLARAAASHSAALARVARISHTSPDGRTFVQRLRGFTRAKELGETIARVTAADRANARLIVRLWMNSPPHRAVLLDGRFRRMGVGARTAVKDSRVVTTVTANFSTPR